MGENRGDIVISSNGGVKTISVSVTVEGTQDGLIQNISTLDEYRHTEAVGIEVSVLNIGTVSQNYLLGIVILR